MLPRLLQLRPFAYHTCSALNFTSIRQARELRSSAQLLAGTQHESLLSIRRKKSQVVSVATGRVEVRDNLPLRLGSLKLETGCSIEQFLHLLNQRVFLWPGNELGPYKPGPPSSTPKAEFERFSRPGANVINKLALQRQFFCSGTT